MTSLLFCLCRGKFCLWWQRFVIIAVNELQHASFRSRICEESEADQIQQHHYREGSSVNRQSCQCPVLARATSCPSLLALAVDVGTPSSVSSSQHHLAISSPATSLRPAFADTRLSSPLSTDRISVATQTAMYIHGSESDVVTHLTPYESLVAQTIPFAPFIQCYACLHGRQPTDDKTTKRGV